MSRTGNLLFPPDGDDGWITAIQKALPKKPPEKPEDIDPADITIDDPVADAADAAFATLAAETAQRDAIEAAGWSATATPPPPEDLSPAARVALDSVVAIEGDDDKDFTAVADPVADAADAAFAAAGAETAIERAVEQAGWEAAALHPDDPTGAAPGADPATTPSGADAEGWQAVTVKPDAPLSPEALAALDAVIDRMDAADLAAFDDPVGLAADAAFATTGASDAIAHAIAEAEWTAESFKAALPEPVAERAVAEAPAETAAEAAAREEAARAAGLDRAVDAAEKAGDLPDPAGDDRVSIAADARFSEIAADVAARDAISEAARADDVTHRPREPLSADELGTLDYQTFGDDDIAQATGIDEDPVAIAADARFSGIAADLAITDAVAAAQWRADMVAPGAMVAARDPDSGPGLYGIEDLVRAEAEIAFEDAAYDLAYSAVDALVTGEAAALAAFDSAIASGADPEEALAAAIEAAESVDPQSFGLARVAQRRPGPEDAGIAAETAAEADIRAEASADADARAETRARESQLAEAEAAEADAANAAASEEETGQDFSIAAVGRGFDAGPFGSVLLSAAGTDIIVGAAEGFRFFLDPDLISLPGAAPRRERDDLVTAPAAAVFANVPGTAAADFLLGSAGREAIGGLEGDDYIYGEVPTNYVAGTHDINTPLTTPTFATSGGADAISGGAGSDTIWGGAGADQIHGDVPESGSSLAGDFTFPLGSEAAGDDEIYGGDGGDTIEGGGGDDTLYGEAGADTLAGNDGADTLSGGAGNDNLFGYAGDDIVIGGQGNDTLEGGAGADTFVFEGGAGADALAHAQSLGTDVITDYSDADGDRFELSDADFGLGAAGALTDGADYFETALQALSAVPLNASGGVAAAGIVVMGAGAGSDGVEVYYTDDASAMTESNSYQIADVAGANLGQIEDADFNLRA